MSDSYYTDKVKEIEAAVRQLDGLVEDASLYFLQSLPFVDPEDGAQDWLYSPRKYTAAQLRHSDAFGHIKRELQNIEMWADYHRSSALARAADKRLRPPEVGV